MLFNFYGENIVCDDREDVSATTFPLNIKSNHRKLIKMKNTSLFTCRLSECEKELVSLMMTKMLYIM